MRSLLHDVAVAMSQAVSRVASTPAGRTWPGGSACWVGCPTQCLCGERVA